MVRHADQAWQGELGARTLGGADQRPAVAGAPGGGDADFAGLPRVLYLART